MSSDLIEEHLQHHLVGLLRQVGQEQDLVGRGLDHGTADGTGRGHGDGPRWRRDGRNAALHDALLLLLLGVAGAASQPLRPLLEGALQLGDDVRVGSEMKKNGSFI